MFVISSFESITITKVHSRLTSGKLVYDITDKGWWKEQSHCYMGEGDYTPDNDQQNDLLLVSGRDKIYIWEW